MARADISEGEELFAIPRTLILSSNSSSLHTKLANDLDKLDPWLSVILVMIYEYLLEEKSLWAPYLAILPKDFDTLMFWSDEELGELQGSAIVDRIGKNEVEESALETVVPIVRRNAALFSPVDDLSSYDGDAGAAALLKLVHIMGSLIMAYGFDIEKADDAAGAGADEDGYVTDEDDEVLSKGMVPFADLLNSDPVKSNVSFPSSLASISMIREDVLNFLFLFYFFFSVSAGSSFL